MAAPARQISSTFSQADWERIRAETFVDLVNYHTEVDSTNTRALELARIGAKSQAALILAERQSAGRGRGENRWWSPSGALTFSLLWTADALPLAPADWPRAALATGLAVSDAVKQFLDGEATQLKWPNDVYLRHRKLGGILVEGASANPGVLVIGIGLNVNNSTAELPPPLADTAISLNAAVGRDLARADLLIAVLQALQSRLSQLATGDPRWLDDWRKQCLLTGRTVQVATHAGVLSGVCRGVDDDGALLLATDQGPQRCLSGVVNHFGE